MMSETKRKIILWLTVIIIGSVLAVFYVKNVQKNLRNFNLDEIKKEIEKIPKTIE